VKIRVEEIKETEKESAFVEPVSEINEALATTGVVDYQFDVPIPVDIRYYRLGSDLMFHGHFDGSVTGTCARCLGNYPFRAKNDFTFVLKPASEMGEDHELAEEDLSLSFYEGDEVDLSPLVREAMMLSLPTRPLCTEDCRGLCPRCGANRNVTDCACRDDWADPRLEVLRALKR
jgi:DUF177 domain-containing protein